VKEEEQRGFLRPLGDAQALRSGGVRCRSSRSWDATQQGRRSAGGGIGREGRRNTVGYRLAIPASLEGLIASGAARLPRTFLDGKELQEEKNTNKETNKTTKTVLPRSATTREEGTSQRAAREMGPNKKRGPIFIFGGEGRGRSDVEQGSLRRQKSLADPSLWESSTVWRKGEDVPDFKTPPGLFLQLGTPQVKNEARFITESRTAST